MKTIHKQSAGDGAFIDGLKQMIASGPALALVPEARDAFDGLIASMTPPIDGVQFEAGKVGGVAGWWCKVTGAPQDASALFLHGGGYVLGSAASSKGLASHLASEAKVNIFVADYSRAPEAPYPSAVNDGLAVLKGLQEGGKRVALVGESAGGGLALLLLSRVAESVKAGEMKALSGAVALSPWIDLSLASPSMDARKAHDPFLSRETLRVAADLYLGSKSAVDPAANAIFAHLEDLPPVQIHVGEDEVLLDDSHRYVENLLLKGGQADLHVWEGMVHVFQMHVGKLGAASESLKLAGQFLREQLNSR